MPVDIPEDPPAPPPFHDPWLSEEAPSPRNRDAIDVRVYRAVGSTREELPNVRVLSITQNLGTDPGRAVFRYAFDGRDPAAPQTFEEALDVSFDLDRCVAENDRLQVIATRPDGGKQFLFDGNALAFALRLNAYTEAVTIEAVGIARRCWDFTIDGQLVRDGENMLLGGDIGTDVPARFNPDGRPNATVLDADSTSGDPTQEHPAFFDERIAYEGKRHWTLEMAARYLIFTNNADQEYTKNPAAGDLKNLYVQRRTVDGQVFDPLDPTTYTVHQIRVGDAPRTGRDWPSTLMDVTRDYGFGMTWRLITDNLTDPENPTCSTHLVPFQNQSGEAKDVYLQPRGALFNPDLTNLGAAEIRRDLSPVVNSWTVQGALKRYEVSVILAPAFPMQAADCASAAAIDAFDRNSANFNGDPVKYRSYIFDEAAQGHYNPGTDAKVKVAGPRFDDVLGEGAYAVRNRPARSTLISVAPNGLPLTPRLSISTDYAPGPPDLWDGTGTWQPVNGGWELLKEQLGIKLTMQNPNEWQIGASSVAGHPFPKGVVKGIEQQAKDGLPRFYLRLTCVIDGDQALKFTAPRRDASPVPDTINRIVDAKDRLRYEVLSKKSEFNNTDDPVVKRDDTETARAEAEANREASEAGILEGSITIPRFTAYYQLGDRIRQINGRTLNFRTDNGGESRVPVYPLVTSVTWNFDGRQETVLGISDEAQQRHHIERKIARNAPRPGKHDR